MTEEDDFLRDNWGKRTNSDLSEHLKRNYMAIRQRAIKLGLEERPTYKRKKKDESQVEQSKHGVEIKAMQTCADALDPLSKEQKQRALRYLSALFNLDWLSGLESVS